MTLDNILLETWREAGAGSALRTPGDQPFVSGLVNGLARVFTENGVAVTPLLVLRTEDLVLASLALRRVLDGFAGDTAELTAADHELLNKAVERRRKAVRELEDACQRAGTPLDKGLADEMAPLIEQAEGVLEDAHAFEQRKREKRSEGKTPEQRRTDD